MNLCLESSNNATKCFYKLWNRSCISDWSNFVTFTNTTLLLSDVGIMVSFHRPMPLHVLVKLLI